MCRRSRVYLKSLVVAEYRSTERLGQKGRDRVADQQCPFTLGAGEVKLVWKSLEPRAFTDGQEAVKGRVEEFIDGCPSDGLRRLVWPESPETRGRPTAPLCGHAIPYPSIRTSQIALMLQVDREVSHGLAWPERNAALEVEAFEWFPNVAVETCRYLLQVANGLLNGRCTRKIPGSEVGSRRTIGRVCRGRKRRSHAKRSYSDYPLA